VGGWEGVGGTSFDLEKTRGRRSEAKMGGRTLGMNASMKSGQPSGEGAANGVNEEEAGESRWVVL